MPGWPWIHDNSISVDLKIDPKRGNTHLTQINMAELRLIVLFTDIGKWFTDIGKWFTDFGNSKPIYWYRLMFYRYQ